MLAPWKNLHSILKRRDITLLTKVHLVNAMVFPVVMCGCESWVIKKGEHPRTDAFELWFWRRLLRVSLTERRSNQSIIQKICLEYSLEGLDAEAVAPILWIPDTKSWLRRPWYWERLRAREEGGNRRMTCLDSITDSMDMNLSKLWGRPGFSF